jgi:hypothetical protein
MPVHRLLPFIVWVVLCGQDRSPAKLVEHPGQMSVDARALVAGNPIEREIGEGQKHTYLIRVAAGEFFHICSKRTIR